MRGKGYTTKNQREIKSLKAQTSVAPNRKYRSNGTVLEHSKNVKETAKRLFIYESLNSDEISKILDLSRVCIRKWINQEEWMDLRRVIAITPEKLIKNTYTYLENVDATIDKRGLPDKETMEIRRLLIVQLKALDSNATHVYAEVLQRFVGYMTKTNPKLVHKVIDEMYNFLLHVNMENKNDGNKDSG